jgi:hypothetical protein
VSKRFPKISTARLIAIGTAVIAVYFLVTGAVSTIGHTSYANRRTGCSKRSRICGRATTGYRH